MFNSAPTLYEEVNLITLSEDTIGLCVNVIIYLALLPLLLVITGMRQFKSDSVSRMGWGAQPLRGDALDDPASRSAK
jgi:hypothetical protein